MIDQYREAFQGEARELLLELESALLELDRNRNDSEAVGRAFRTLHTIKGTGAMFGFDEVAGFAHNLETAFDGLRNGRLAATTDLINLALAAGDQIKTMLDEAAGRGAADQDRSAGILAELRQLTGSPEPRTDKAPLLPEVHGGAGSGLAHDWRIRFRPGPNLLSNGANPLLLLRELRGLGELQIDLDTSAIPPLGEIAADCCYLAWDMVLTTAAASDAIRDVFIFVEDDCELTIERAPNRAAETPAQAIAPAAQGVTEGRSAAASGTASSIRVSAEKLDQFVNLVGELVTVQARLSEFAARRDDPEILAVSEEDRAADVGSARELDEHPHACPSAPPSRSSAAWCTTWRATWTRTSS